MGKKHRHENEQEDDASITITKTGLWQIISFILLVVLVISIVTGGFGIASTGTANGGAPTNNKNNNAGTAGQINLQGAHIEGDPNAPVTIVEWSDFECPFCERFYTQTYGDILKNYVDTGKAKIVFKEFPLTSLHPDAMPAAIAAECAGNQGKFFEMHNKLFENQQSLGTDNYKKWAAELGLDTAKFNSCYDNKETQAKIQADQIEGEKLGIRGTPGFIINGQTVSGAQPYAVFQAAIESGLKGQ